MLGEPVWPAQALEVLPTSGIVAKLGVHLLESPRIINSRDRMSRAFHPFTLLPLRRSVKGIPNFSFFHQGRPTAAGEPQGVYQIGEV